MEEGVEEGGKGGEGGRGESKRNQKGKGESEVFSELEFEPNVQSGDCQESLFFLCGENSENSGF